MKKIIYFLSMLLLVGLNACDNGPKFNVQGEVSGAEDKMLYLDLSGVTGVTVLDSVDENDRSPLS